MRTSASATLLRSSRIAKRRCSFLLPALFLSSALLWWPYPAAAVFRVHPPPSNGAKVAVPLAFKPGEFVYDCGKGEILFVDILPEGNGSFLLKFALLLPGGARGPAATARKFGWQVPLMIDEENDKDALLVRKTTIHSNFKANEPFYTGTRYSLVQENRFSDGRDPTVSGTTFWFKAATLNSPGRGKINVITATTLSEGKDRELHRISFSPDTMTIERFVSATKQAQKGRVCWRKDKP